MSTTETVAAPTRAYEHIVRAVCSPWALQHEAYMVIVDIVDRRLRGDQLTDEEITDRVGARLAHREPMLITAGDLEAAGRSRRGGAQTAGAVAVIPIYGVITNRAGLLGRMSGGTSVEDLTQQFRTALNDPAVGSILFDIDSPGGSTDGIPELANEIAASRGSKPIGAIANTLCASGAYWLGSQADELACTPSGMVGSIGVYAAHQDMSRMQEQRGISTTLISAGKYKTEGNPYGPLTAEGHAAIKQAVDEFYDMFVADVARGRGATQAKVRDGFGEGRVVTASAAKGERMIDRVATFDDMVRRLAAGAVTPGKRQAAYQLPADGKSALLPEAGSLTADELEGFGRLEALDLAKGQTLVLTVPQELGRERAAGIRGVLHARYPENPVIVLGAGVQITPLELDAAAIPVHSTPVVDVTWDGPGEEAKIPNTAGAVTLRKMYAWVDSAANQATKAAYKLPHHQVVDGTPGAAVISGVRNAMARIPTMKPALSAADEKGVRAHLQRHIDDFEAKKAEAISPARTAGETQDRFDGTSLLRRRAVRAAFKPTQGEPE